VTQSRESLTADKQELYEVLLRYCRAIDRQEYELLRTVFHPDGIDDHGGLFSGGVDDLIASCKSGLAGYSITTHAITNAFFKVAGSYAEGETYVLANHITREPTPKIVTMSARYLDRFEKRNVEWRIIYRTYVLDWTNLPSWDPQGAKGQTDRSDLSYRALPMFA
jgi:hypothetical protein